jgi:hypothetical protein
VASWGLNMLRILTTGTVELTLFVKLFIAVVCSLGSAYICKPTTNKAQERKINSIVKGKRTGIKKSGAPTAQRIKDAPLAQKSD